MEIEIKSCENNIKKSYDNGEIVRISSEDLSFSQFFNEFMITNTPVIIKNVDLLTPVSKSWFSGNKININKLEDDLGDLNVPVYNCSKKYFNSHEKISMKFKDYAHYFKSENKEDVYYLKDFHLKRRLPDLDFYNIPKFFVSDWLNEYLIDENKDDYRFVYIGVRGTWTPLHADVFNSYSWSGNVCGRKRWLIILPGEELKLMDSFNQLPLSVDESALVDKNVRFFDIIQESNEILFVPSRWYHQVFNLTDVFSINHNWFNSCNAHIIKESLFKNLQDVKTEIQDCCDMDNFDDHCQMMLKSLFGMDFQDFVKMLFHIGRKRIKKLKENEDFKLFEEYDIGVNLAKYEMNTIEQILNEMLTADCLSEELMLEIKNFLLTNVI